MTRAVRLSLKGEVGEDAFCRGGENFDVGEVVEFGVAAGEVGGGFGDFNSGHFLELVREREGEKS